MKMTQTRTPIAALCALALTSAPMAFAQDGQRSSKPFDDNRVGTIDMSSTPGSGGQYAGPELRNLGYDQAEARRLQQALAARGFDPGPIDGILGNRTRAALRAFQQQQKLAGAGRFDRETATALGLSDFDDNTVGAIDMSSTPGSGGQYSGPEHRASDRGMGATAMQGGASFQGMHDVIELQRALSARGFDPGPIDGVMGPQTRRALMSYQRQHNLAASGSLDRDTVAALGWKQRTGDLNDDRAGTIDMSSTPGSGGKYAGPERRSPVTGRDSGSSAGGGVDTQQGGAGGR